MEDYDKRLHRSNQLLIAASILLFLVTIAQWVNAQNVGINSTGASPDASAILDVSSSDKGLLTPRVALTATGSATPITSPATSLLVYNTATAGDVTPGYYYWDGAKWIRLINNTNPSGGDWSLTGNSGTTVGTNFLGTTDAEDLAIYTNNAERVRVTSGGNVGIGSTSPSQLLDVNGNLRIGDLTSGTSLRIDGATSSKRYIVFRTGAANRWLIETNEAAESGGNIGSDFNIWRYDDTGASLGTVFGITRSTGNAAFVHNLGVGAIVARSRLHVNGGDINIESIGSGVIIKSPDGSCWRVTVDNSGNMVTTSITCP